MKHIFHAMLLCTCAPILALQTGAADPARFAETIDTWTALDKKNPPPENLVLFIGSSSIKMWKSLERDFPGTNVLNRGFGGSWTNDLLHYMDRIVLPYKPARIVVYCGENDIAHGEAPLVPFENWKTFVARVRKVRPDTKFYYIPIKPNPKRWNFWPKYQQANRLIQQFCEKEGLAYLGDIPRKMLGQDGMPIPGIFAEDKLHLNAEGYKIWAREVRKALGMKE